MRSICESATKMTPSTPFKMSLRRGVVEDLPGHRVEVEARLEAADLAERQRQEVEEERSLGLRREADHLPLVLGVRALVDVLEVRRLPAETGPVIDQLAVDLAGHVVDEAHRRGSLPLSR